MVGKQPRAAQHLAEEGLFSLVKAYRADVARRHSPKTARLYRRRVFDTAADLMLPIEGWTPQVVSEYLEGFHTASANQIRSALVDLFDWRVERGLAADNPLREITTRRGARTRVPKSLTDDELTRLVIAAAWGPRWRDRWATSRRRLALMILGHYYTGLRPGELCCLQTSHLHLDTPAPYIEVVETKTNEDRVVPLSLAAVDVFAELSHDRVGRVSNMSARTYWDQVSSAAERAGLPREKRKPYMLRHTFATRLIERGVHQRVVSQLLGHSDPRSTMIYTVPHDPALRDAVEVL